MFKPVVTSLLSMGFWRTRFSILILARQNPIQNQTKSITNAAFSSSLIKTVGHFEAGSQRRKGGSSAASRHGFIVVEHKQSVNGDAFLRPRTSALRRHHRCPRPVRFRVLHSCSGRDDPSSLPPQGCRRRRRHRFWENTSFRPTSRRDSPSFHLLPSEASPGMKKKKTCCRVILKFRFFSHFKAYLFRELLHQSL